MLASQKTATRKIARLRITSHVPELKKSFTPLKRSSEAVVVVVSAERRPVMSSQEQLADDVPRGERDSCKCQDHDRGEDVDAQSRPASDGTPSGRAARSASRYSDPVTRTAPSAPAIERASASASPGSCSVSVLSNHGFASVASSSADSARELPDAVATTVSPRTESAASIFSASLSRRIETTR